MVLTKFEYSTFLPHSVTISLSPNVFCNLYFFPQVKDFS